MHVRSKSLLWGYVFTVISLMQPNSLTAWEDEKSVITTPQTIFLVPLGPVDTGTLEYLKSALPVPFHAAVQVGEAMPVPGDSFDARRKQYNSSKILEHLFDARRDPRQRWLGVTESDLFVPTLNFVFGEADSQHHIAVISLARLREEFFRRKSDPALFHQRALKEAVHELGHSYGLTHCSNFRCVMFFSNSLADTDRKSSNFCEDHRRELEAAMKK
jgi:archaemetzincin